MKRDTGTLEYEFHELKYQLSYILVLVLVVPASLADEKVSIQRWHRQQKHLRSIDGR